MARGVASDVDRDGKPRDVGSTREHVHSQRGSTTSKSRRANSQLIHSVQQLLLQRNKSFIFVFAAHTAEKRFLAEVSCSLHGAAHTPPTIIGGQALAPAAATVSSTNRFTPSTPSLGGSIRNALLFSLPNPLGETVTLKVSPGTNS